MPKTSSVSGNAGYSSAAPAASMIVKVVTTSTMIGMYCPYLPMKKMKATCALCENEEKDAVQDDQDDQDDDDLHQAGVHVEPAVVDAPVVVVLEAHVEQDDEGRHAPPNLKITISTSVSHHLHQHVLKPNLKIKQFLFLKLSFQSQ